MSTAMQRASPQTQTLEIDPQQASALLEKVLEATAANGRYKFVEDELGKRVEKLRQLLPDALKPHAERFVRRALLTFSRRPELGRCTPASFIRCVLEAAELGLAVDGRLAHAVPFNNKVKDKATGQERWVSEAQMMPDYKGILAVARRVGTVRDAYARLVHDADDFQCWEEDGDSHLVHRFDARRPRGEVIGAYAILKFPDGGWRHEYMDLADLDRIRGRSRSFQKKQGPWLTDDGEMRKKTVLKRALKTYAEDPALVRALELDDRDYEDREPPGPAEGPPLGRTSLRGNGHAAPEPEPPDPTVYPERPVEDFVNDGPSPDDFDGPAQDPGPPPEEEMQLLDRVHDISSAIGQAETVRQLEDGPGRAMAEWKERLGESRYAPLLEHYQRKFRELRDQEKKAAARK